jgi:hypothetical protein
VIIRSCPLLILVLVMTLALKPVAAQRRSNPRMRCTPSIIEQGNTLTLQMPTSHGGELGVWTPKHRFLFIAYEFDAQANPIQPPIPSAEFLKVRSIALSPLSAKGVDLSGRTPQEPLFTAAGMYRFIVSDNLETEDDTHENLICDVRYRPRQAK